MRNTVMAALAALALISSGGCGGPNSAADETVMSDLGGDPAYEPTPAVTDESARTVANAVDAAAEPEVGNAAEQAGNGQEATETEQPRD